MYLARKIDHDLYLWHYNTNDVLVVQGPPCVGKTTSIQHYVKENFAYYYIIDLEDKIGKKFSKSSLRMHRTLMTLTKIFHKTVIHTNYTLSFLSFTRTKEHWTILKIQY